MYIIFFFNYIVDNYFSKVFIYGYILKGYFVGGYREKKRVYFDVCNINCELKLGFICCLC